MEERRRSKRTEMSSTLMVKRLDQGDMQEVSIAVSYTHLTLPTT